MTRIFLIMLGLLVSLGAASAQTAPTAREVAAYDGLFLAAHQGDLAAIEQLLEEGADPNAHDRRGRTPAHVAAFAERYAVLEMLAAAGADLNALEYRLYDVVTIAAVADDPDMVALAIRLGNRPDLVTSVYAGTALIAAAHLGHHQVVRILVDAGAPLDHVNNLNWTAVIEAIVLGDGGADHQETLRILVEAGADLTIADGAGQTPMELAVERGFDAMVRILEGAP